MVEHPPDFIPDLLHRRGNTKPRDNFGLREKKIEFEIRSRMTITCSLKVLDGDMCEFSATFDRSTWVDRECGQIVPRHRLVTNEPYLFHPCGGGGDGKQAVFIDSIDVLQDEEQVVPSVVRLCPLDQRSLPIWQPADIAGAVSLEEFTGFLDGEDNVPIESWVYIQPELPEQVFEGRLEVVTDVSQDERDAGGQGFPVRDICDYVARLAFTYNPKTDLIGLSSSEPLHNTVQGSEMDIRSFELIPGAIPDASVSYSFQRGKSSIRR